MSLRVAFIGAGQMARNHIQAIGRTGLPADIVGVHDPLVDRAGAFAALAGTQTYPSVRALLADTRPDVVHVCTPPAGHVEAASAALEAGAHVYVEKPFAPTAADASRLLELADRQGRLVCAGHQLLFDPAFTELVDRGSDLGDLVQADSHFAFRPSGAGAPRAGARALAPLLVDILPHPLYSLIAVLERFGPPAAAVEIDWARGGPADLHASLRAGDIVGRLSVSLRARPVASSLTMTGTRGALTCDLVRSIVVGAANPGAAALEKVLNPMVEGMQLMGRTARSVGRRVLTGVSYPGLAELIAAFYNAIDRGAPSPISPSHLLRVTGVFEQLVARIDAATAPVSHPAAKGAAAPAPVSIPRGNPAPLVVVTGARGFLGGEVVRALDRVRGIGRSANSGDPHVHEWVVADLSRGVSPEALAGADVVVHAAAETAGDFDAHQRNTIDATRHLLHAMHEAGVSRLVLVSSLSVLRPPRTPWERQNEQTPRPDDPVRFGPYVWGKSLQEALVEREAPALGIAVRIIRPGALVDDTDPSLPGLMGRHLFGRWHLGLGRSRLPIAVCDVIRCAEAIAWSATHFGEAPPIVNLFDPAVTTRGTFLRRLRERGWKGRVVWVPISAISFAVVTARTAQAFLRGRLPVRLAAWSVLKPRRYDSQVAAKVPLRVPITVFVTDGNQRPALAIVRALGRRGLTVIVGDDRPVSLAGSSRYCTRRVTYPSPDHDRGAFDRFLQGFIVREQIDVVIPVTDVTTHAVCANQEALRRHCVLAVPPLEAFELVTNKARLLEYAGRCGVPVPRTLVVDGRAQLPEVIDRVRYPAVVKPVHSRVRTGAGWLAGSAHYAYSRAELEGLFDAHDYLAFHPSLIQERIVGPGVGMFALFDRGRLVAEFSHRRLREKPPAGGASVLSESLPVDPRLREFAVRMLGPIGWHGVAMMEYKQDRRSGELVLMEVNGRFWGSLELAVDAGVDFPFLTFQLARGIRPDAPPEYQPGVRNRWILGDLDHLLLRLFRSADALDLPDGADSTARTLLDFLKVVQPRLHYEVISASDWRPFACELRHYVRDMGRALLPRGDRRPAERAAPALAGRDTAPQVAVEP